MNIRLEQPVMWITSWSAFDVDIRTSRLCICDFYTITKIPNQHLSCEVYHHFCTAALDPAKSYQTLNKAFR